MQPPKINKVFQKETDSVLPLEQCLAKTYVTKNGEKCAGRTVLNHCHIVGEVARSLIARLPNWLNDIFPSGAELIAGAHDTGKISPTFQEKIYRGIDGYIANSLTSLTNINPLIEKNWGGHAGVSQLAVGRCCVGKYIPEIIGQHHGYSPNLAGYLATDGCFGGDIWQLEREKFIISLKELLKTDWPVVQNPLHARVLAGLTTVSDWIGSGYLFEEPNNFWQSKIEVALDNAGFVRPEFIKGLSFEDIFGFKIRDVQKRLVQCCTQPGVYILEAPMGLGKTEAALYAAYQMMSLNKATGFYFALPTQLTSDKIHDRVNDFLKKIISTNSHHHQALLLHSNAWLRQIEMGEEGQPGGSWFHGSKRGILAPFAVGTIDQALMAVMNVKHGFVRTFGLVGKVVILDEVHSYDAYTGTILDKLINDLRDLHCTVIILSATLSQKRRENLLRIKSSSNAYPLITSIPKDKLLEEFYIQSIESRNIKIQLCQDHDLAIEEALYRAEQGQQVLWIENTVDDAQTRFKMIAAKAAELKIECGLLHSRFLKNDKEKIEERWVSLLGKRYDDQRLLCGRILVGTQVLEQSLDIDADFLVTRICPTDMLLQRIGRLWRHKETKRPTLAKQEVWILTPTLMEVINNPEKNFGKTALIYSPYVLYRTLKVWHELTMVNLPEQIRELIEKTYEENNFEIDAMIPYKQDIQNTREKLEKLALVGLSNCGKTLPENKASTRFNEQPTVEVLLIKSFTHEKNRNGTQVKLLNDEKIFLPLLGRTQDRKHWKDLSSILMKNIVKMNEYIAPNSLPISKLKWLKDYLYLGDDEYEESHLRIAKIQSDGTIISLDTGSASDTHKLTYDIVLGYQAKKL